MSEYQNELSKIQRPKLLMSTAKVLVEKRRYTGKIGRAMTQAELLKLLKQEAEMENQRTHEVAIYHVNRHIEVLANLIEQVYAHQNLVVHC